MPTLSVRVSEDPARPLGHAIVTLGGLPRTLETFEFALSRHGFAASHLGADGWQGAECWLQPEEVWYSGDALKFVIHPDLAFQLENMPYTLTVRGQGLTESAAVTFVWPLELEIEAGAASGERRLVGGTRVDSAPKLRPEPAASAIPSVEPPPLPAIGDADLTIPDVAIPEIGVNPPGGDEDSAPTQMVEGRRARKPLPPLEEPTRGVVEGARPAVADAEHPPGAEPTRAVSGRWTPPARAGQPSPAWPAPVSGPGPVEEPSPSATLPQRAIPPAEPALASSDLADEERRTVTSGFLIGLLLLAALAALGGLGGWWWFSHQTAKLSAASMAVPPSSVAPASIDRAPEPRPAPEPVPAPPPVPAPEPRPAPEPVPAPPPVPAPEPRPAPEAIAPEQTPLPPPIPGSVTPVPPTAPAAVPAPGVSPGAPSTPPARPDSGRSLEDELKSQFDPTLQELEKGLRRPKSPP
jgi:hypothetical protein